MAKTPIQAESVCEHTDAFERALTAYLAARNRLDELDGESDVEMDQAVEVFSLADAALIRQPARSLEQLRTKAEVIWADPSSLASREHLQSFFSDLIELTERSPSRTFQPERWVARFLRLGGSWTVFNDQLSSHTNFSSPMRDCIWELHTRGGHEAALALLPRGDG